MLEVFNSSLNQQTPEISTTKPEISETTSGQYSHAEYNLDENSDEDDFEKSYFSEFEDFIDVNLIQ